MYRKAYNKLENISCKLQNNTFPYSCDYNRVLRQSNGVSVLTFDYFMHTSKLWCYNVEIVNRELNHGRVVLICTSAIEAIIKHCKDGCIRALQISTTDSIISGVLFDKGFIVKKDVEGIYKGEYECDLYM